MLEQCPQFTAGNPQDFTNEGTERHVLFRKALEGMPTDDEAVTWAVEYVKCHAPMSDHTLELERKLTLVNEDFTILMEGTPDVVCGAEIFDLKWRKRNYTAQMAAYAAMLDRKFVKVHTLFAESQTAFVQTFSREDALAIVLRIMKANGEPQPCDYCGWCAKKLECSALLQRANAVTKGREDWKLEQYHCSEIKTADQMGKALHLARAVGKWADAVEYHAKEMAQKQGMVPAGFKVGKSTGRSWCADVPRAFQLAGVPQEEFLKACDLRLNTSKKYPDKVGLTDLYAKQSGMKKTPAAREIKTKLAETLRKGADGIKLLAVNQTEEEGEE